MYNVNLQSNSIHYSGSSLYDLWFFLIFSFKQTRGGSYHRSYELDKERVSLSPSTASLMGLSQSLTHAFGLTFQSTDTLKLLWWQVCVSDQTLSTALTSTSSLSQILFEGYIYIFTFPLSSDHRCQSAEICLGAVLRHLRKRRKNSISIESMRGSTNNMTRPLLWLIFSTVWPSLL